MGQVNGFEAGTVYESIETLTQRLEWQPRHRANKGDLVNLVKHGSLALLISLAGIGAIAQEATETNTSTITVPDTLRTDGQRKDVDEEITNARLRAETGAKKLISVSTSFSYSGAALTNPTSTERPQLNDNQTSADPTRLNGQMAAKYRVTDNDNLSVGFGLEYTPSYVSDRETNTSEPARVGASSPFVSYGRVFKSGSFQNSFSASLSKYTAYEDVQDAKRNWSADVSHIFMTPVGTSGLELGMATSFVQSIFSDEHRDVAPKQYASSTIYQFSLNPIAEYAFNDRYSFRTVYRWVTYSVLAGDREKAVLSDQTQSMGLGIAVLRDLYLYPNMQWKWSNASADQTTVGLSAYINL